VTDPHIEELEREATYRRERYALYRARVAGPRPTTAGRLRTLKQDSERAAARLAAARHRQA
jgi:hypothetical protein